jgi:hypothetical protein
MPYRGLKRCRGPWSLSTRVVQCGLMFVFYWSDGVLECCNKVAGIATITPVLQYSNALKLI